MNRTLRHRNPLIVCGSLATGILLLAGGCGERIAMVPLHGKVLYRGKPLEYGSVMFQPVGSGTLARGPIQPDGTFRLTTSKEGDGVQIGKSRVRITAYEAQRGGLEENTREEMPLGRSAIPLKYANFGTSEIVIDVAPDMDLPLVIRLQED